MFGDIYKDKKVLITGNTGFKGSWLTVWLLNMQAEIVGFSIDIPTQPSMFEELEIEPRLKQYWGDVRNFEEINEVIKTEKPDFIFHLAAQAIVSTSYADPLGTIAINVMGTANILNALKDYEHHCTAILITSDKCYENVEWVWGYKETDALGGKDIYSGSKGAAEVIIHSFTSSFFSNNHNVRIASARAGNVIGGGDWAKNRIIPDTMLAWSNDDIVEIRSPHATRPWQHVLEPLSGYLSLGHQLSENADLHGESFNFGPRSDYNFTVTDILKGLSKFWGKCEEEDIYEITDNVPFHEAGLLKLNCDKSLFHLKWMPTLEYDSLLSFTGLWYYNYYKEKTDNYAFTANQIADYVNVAKGSQIKWAL